MFHEQLSRNPPEDTFKFVQKAARPAHRSPLRCLSPQNQPFKPWRLGFVGLAVAVFLWGFGYKVSLYHKSQSNAPVVKMWVEQRNTPTVLGSSSNGRFSHLPTLQALSVVVQLDRPDRSSILCITNILRRDLNYFDSLIPPRSPPPQSFL